MSILKIAIVPVFLTLVAVGLSRQRRRLQIRFVREILARNPAPVDPFRVVVSLSTLPDRIPNLQPTIESVINQTRSPDEIVLALPDTFPIGWLPATSPLILLFAMS